MCRRIASALGGNFQSKWQEVDRSVPSDELTVAEKMKMSNVQGAQDENEKAYDTPLFSEARTFVTQSNAFQWLLGKIQAAVKFTNREGTVMDAIRDSILANLNSLRAKVGGPPPQTHHQLVFKIEWSPLDFLEEQYSNIGEDYELGKVITLNGSAVDAQAVTCAQYMHQMWPSTGDETMRGLDAAISRKQSRASKCVYLDGTEAQITISDSFVLVSAIGAECILAEIGEQLAWLGSACRASTQNDKLSYCTARIIRTQQTPTLSFTIDYSHSDIKEVSMPTHSGTCWHSLFRNPVIVKGYPIPARDFDEKGLEIPLNMMAGLSDATRVTKFDGGLLIKGFSTGFVPTRTVQNSVIWHFCYNNDGSRLSYLFARDCCPEGTLENADTLSLANTRNFVGWTQSALSKLGESLSTGSMQLHIEPSFLCDLFPFVQACSNLYMLYDVGTKEAAYEIGWTGSNFSSSGCAFEGTTISLGKFIVGGANFRKGNKDTRINLERSGPYVQELDFARSMHVVLYDTKDRRGWLVDGASALLHLTRSQLSFPGFCANVKLSEFHHADLQGGADAAMEALKDPGNRQLVIADETERWEEITTSENGSETREKKEKKTEWCFEHLVRQTWSILEQIRDHQSRLLASPGIGLRGTDREKLEGFGFRDIVQGEGPLRPRVATLEPSGRGWVDFIKEVGAITLLGHSFGELIRPTEEVSNQLCIHWKRVPRNQDYLTTRVSTLESICEKYGDSEANPLELAQGIYWHKADKLFEACDCDSARKSTKCDRVQVLLPPSLGSKRHPHPFKYQEGAVIFGRSKKYSLHWPNTGPPEVLTHEQAVVDDLPSDDSGLGTSVNTTSLAAKSHPSGSRVERLSDSAGSLSDKIERTKGMPANHTAGSSLSTTQTETGSKRRSANSGVPTERASGSKNLRTKASVAEK